jgi:hypothetical protein
MFYYDGHSQKSFGRVAAAIQYFIFLQFSKTNPVEAIIFFLTVLFSKTG